MNRLWRSGNMLAKAEVIDQLQAIYVTVQALIHDLSPAEWDMRPQPEEWSIKDLVAHLAFWDQNFTNLLRSLHKLEARVVLSGTADEINARVYTENRNRTGAAV